EAARGRRRVLYLPLLAVSLAAGIWAHYYGALAAVPIVAGEFVRLIRSRRPDWGVLASLAAAAIACLPLYGMAVQASVQSATYFQKVSLSQIPIVYYVIARFLIGPWPLSIGLVVIVAVVAASFVRGSLNESPEIPAHEIVAALTTMLIPVWAILGGLVLSKAFVPRYAMGAVVGYFLVIPLMASRIRSPWAPLLLCVLTALAMVRSTAAVLSQPPIESPLSYRPLLTRALSQQAPVVVTGTLYLQMWYYSPQEHRARLSYVADRVAALRLIGTDSLDGDYLALRQWASIGVEDYDTFVRTHRFFYLYYVPALSWLPLRLQEQGAEFREIGQESGATLYTVTLHQLGAGGRRPRGRAAVDFVTISTVDHSPHPAHRRDRPPRRDPEPPCARPSLRFRDCLCPLCRRRRPRRAGAARAR